MKNLVVAFNTAQENILLEFSNSQEADEVFSNWKLEYLGGKTNIRKTNSRSEQKSAVIKGVPNDIEEYICDICETFR